MSTIAPLDRSIIDQWLASRPQPSAMEMQLQSLGISPEVAKEYVKAYRKTLQSRRQTKGFILMSVGAILGFISCVLTLINPIPAIYGLVLYGLTSIAMMVIVLGLYFVLET